MEFTHTHQKKKKKKNLESQDRIQERDHQESISSN